jgi:hypothetical protein
VGQYLPCLHKKIGQGGVIQSVDPAFKVFCNRSSGLILSGCYFAAAPLLAEQGAKLDRCKAKDRILFKSFQVSFSMRLSRLCGSRAFDMTLAPGVVMG